MEERQHFKMFLMQAAAIFTEGSHVWNISHLTDGPVSQITEDLFIFTKVTTNNKFMLNRKVQKHDEILHLETHTLLCVCVCVCVCVSLTSL